MILNSGMISVFIYRKNSIFEKDYRQIYEELRENGKMARERKFQK